MRAFRSLFFVLFAIVLLVCVYFHVYLIQIPLDYDEIFTAVTSDPSHSWSYLVTNYLRLDVHPPLYNFVIWAYRHLVSYEAEWMLRLPSLFFGIAGLAAGWFLFPKRYGRTARWIFFFLLLCNNWLIFYTQYLRAYSMMLLGGILWTFLYLHLSVRIRHHRPIFWKDWLYYTLLALWLCYSHYFGALAFGVVAVLLFIQACKANYETRGLIVSSFGVFLLFLLWLWPNFLENLSQRRFSGNWWANEWIMLGPSIGDMWQWIFPEWISFLFGRVWMGAALLFLGMLSGYFTYKKKYRLAHGRDMLILVLPWVIAWGITWVLSYKLFLFFDRYFIAFVPALYLALALLLAPLFHCYKKLICLLLALAGCFIFCFERDFAWRKFLYHGMNNAHLLASYVRQHNINKIFVIAIEGYPGPTMDSLYAWYPNRGQTKKVQVTELMHLMPAQRDRLLITHSLTPIWMPACEDWKVDKLRAILPFRVTVIPHNYGACFLHFS